jgi:hypothetical protein
VLSAEFSYWTCWIASYATGLRASLSSLAGKVKLISYDLQIPLILQRRTVNIHPTFR